MYVWFFVVSMAMFFYVAVIRHMMLSSQISHQTMVNNDLEWSLLVGSLGKSVWWQLSAAALKSVSQLDREKW